MAWSSPSTSVAEYPALCDPSTAVAPPSAVGDAPLSAALTWATRSWMPRMNTGGSQEDPAGTSPSASSTSPGPGRFRSSLARQAATSPRSAAGTDDRSGSCCRTRMTMVGIAPSPNGPTPPAAYTSTAP